MSMKMVKLIPEWWLCVCVRVWWTWKKGFVFQIWGRWIVASTGGTHLATPQFPLRQRCSRHVDSVCRANGRRMATVSWTLFHSFLHLTINHFYVLCIYVTMYAHPLCFIKTIKVDKSPTFSPNIFEAFAILIECNCASLLNNYNELC